MKNLLFYSACTTFALTEQKVDKKKKEEVKLWFPLRVTYNRELKVKADLDKLGVTNFVPMQYRREERNGQMVKRLVPSVHNLIFVQFTPSEMTAYKKSTALPIRYIMNRVTRRPVTVPDNEMENFIRVAAPMRKNSSTSVPTRATLPRANACASSAARLREPKASSYA